ncbi:MAG: NAD(P)/FAD-dependent oxidoreductase [Cyclonatronaceae bacterium]
MNVFEHHSIVFYDVTVVGSGFAGSLTAAALSRLGYRVLLVEKGRHPRFALGESSTPVADMILRRLADVYDLPELRPLSRYGSWQRAHPELRCGIKRGFSYFFHEAGKAFRPDAAHSRELLVAASSSDEASDTQWYRPHTDAFFVELAQKTGVCYRERTQITRCDAITQARTNGWQLRLEHADGSETTQTAFIIDATGGPEFARRFFGAQPSEYRFKTRSRALYSHFENVNYWQEYLVKAPGGAATADYPFHADHAALHHLLDEGWLWMLRFNDGRLSAGLMLDEHTAEPGLLAQKPDALWEAIIRKYPGLSAIFESAELAEMPGSIKLSPPLQRLQDDIAGRNWASLPHSAGFVDPLHSTGIAHSLSGAERILELFRTRKTPVAHYDEAFDTGLQTYSRFISAEIRHIDRLISGSYITRRQPLLFQAWLSWYFAGTIRYEQARLAGDLPSNFLFAEAPQLSLLIEQSYEALLKLKDQGFPADSVRRFIEQTRRDIAPYNKAGLLASESAAPNMYAHTAVQLG